MEWLNEVPWLVWLGVALVAGVVEVLTLDFFFLMVAGGAMAGSLAAGFNAPVPLQIVVFALATVALLVGARPPLKRWSHTSTPLQVTGTGALIGQGAVVLTPVTERSGEVKLAGEVWTARSGGSPTAPLEAGSAVTVVRIDGATAIVAPVVNPEN